MEKGIFRNIVRILVQKATMAREDKTIYGEQRPHLANIYSNYLGDLTGVRQYDTVLAEKLEKVEAAHQEVDDYILARRELIGA